jgi:D-sedoheptulose 7-phosphate isomerase
MKGFLKPRPLGEVERSRLATSWPEGGAALAARLQGAVRAIDLTAQAALSSAIGNDLGSELVFAQQVHGYGREGDILVAFSTSGNSANVLAAVRVAKARGMAVIGFSGGQGGRLAELCDAAILVPAAGTPEIQLGHLAAYHALCAEVEERLFGSRERG